MLPTLEITLVRHGETAWSLAGRHTSFTDLELTDHGKAQAEQLKARLSNRKFDYAFVSPLKRAQQTAELANLSDWATTEPALTEWNYGEFEGLTTDQIRKNHSDWILFRDGAPNGESPPQVQKRADALIAKLRTMGGNIALVSSGHFLRAFAARWLSLPVAAGQHLFLSTASIGTLGYEREIPVIKLWNETQTIAQIPRD